MRFKTAIIPFVGDDSWVEAALIRAKQTLEKRACPTHSERCEYGKFIEQIRSELDIEHLAGEDVICEIHSTLRIINSELSRWLNPFQKNFITRNRVTSALTILLT